MEFKDYYKIMGVTRDASQEDIKRAYRKLACKYHPDVSRERNAEERFKELGEAYEVLKDQEKRAAYDRIATGRQHGERFTPPPDWSFNFGFGGGFTGRGAAGFSDFFDSLFGRNTGRRRREPRGGWTGPYLDKINMPIFTSVSKRLSREELKRLLSQFRKSMRKEGSSTNPAH